MMRDRCRVTQRPLQARLPRSQEGRQIDVHTPTGEDDEKKICLPHGVNLFHRRPPAAVLFHGQTTVKRS
jgi:hypothetical protein